MSAKFVRELHQILDVLQFPYSYSAVYRSHDMHSGGLHEPSECVVYEPCFAMFCRYCDVICLCFKKMKSWNQMSLEHSLQY